MKKYLPIFFPILLMPGIALAGSQSFDAPGSYSFAVPAYGTITVQLWGGGGSGGGGAHLDCEYVTQYGGNPGNPSSFGSVVANGGAGGWPYGSVLVDPCGSGYWVPDSNIEPGGTASGGDTNISGGDAYSDPSHKGGDSPYGGAGGDYGASNGGFPGGGGGGMDGGGAGGYSEKTYSPGALAVNSTINVVVGNGGAAIPPNGTYGYPASGAGGNGRVYVTWVDDPCPTPIESYWGGGTYLLWSGATRRINTAGYNFCISNSSGYNYFVPGASGGEIGSFYNAHWYLPGLTTF